VPHSNVHEFEVNVLGVVAMTKAVLPSMRGRRRGHIIASMVGYIDMPHAVLACARLREGPLVSIRLSDRQGRQLAHLPLWCREASD
jgi:NAD(P)-dependent dehydrogenase (short-subunit alcohol dehydrogenase family)